MVRPARPVNLDHLPLAEQTSMIDAIDAARTLLSAPSALITDVDGTISPIVAHPEDARVGEGVREALRQLTGLLSLVAVVTARAENVARRMVGVDGLVYVGNYGLHPDATVAIEPLLAVKPEIHARLAGIPGLQLEDKGAGLAIHFRNTVDPEVARRQVLDVIDALAARHELRLQEGKQVVEVLPRDLPDKAAAVARLLDDRGIKGAVYLGDDLSDISVFRMLRERRQTQGLPGWSVAVVDAETDSRVAEAADQLLDGVAAVEQFLGSLVLALQTKGTALC